MPLDVAVKVRFCPPPDDLQRYFTTFYVTEIDPAQGVQISDALHPEWANLRFFDGASPDARIDGGAHISGARFAATGPSSRCTHFAIGATRFWGVGLLPLGWTRFVGAPAADHANLVADGHTHPSFTRFAPLADSLFTPDGDEAAEFQRIADFFRGLPATGAINEALITAIHQAVIDPYLTTVAELVERVGASQRKVERMCHRAFGFSPKLLLRRQRFMRSLTHFMLDPSLKWIGALDGSYHDQAQFVRDFHEFMGMTPRDYAARPHPILETFMRERMRVRGAAVQTLDRPDGNDAR